MGPWLYLLKTGILTVFWNNLLKNKNYLNLKEINASYVNSWTLN